MARLPLRRKMDQHAMMGHSALLLFASILLHKLGHALVARRYGVEIEEIDLWLLGGVARMSGYPKAAGDELRFALAGPAVTMLVALVFGAIVLALPSSASAELTAIAEYQLFVNAAILAFNLLPAFPLDGGRVARALLWARTGDLSKATRRAASIGRGLGYVMIGLGVFAVFAGLVSGLWFALVGLFVTAAGRAEENGLLIRKALAGRAAGALAAMPAVTVPAGISVASAIRDYLLRYQFSAFPVFEGDRLLGLIDAPSMERVPSATRDHVTVREVTIGDPSLVVDFDHDVAELLERPAFQRVGRAVVRAGDGSVGIVSITDVDRVVHALELGGELRSRSA